MSTAKDELVRLIQENPKTAPTVRSSVNSLFPSWCSVDSSSRPPSDPR